MLNNFSVYLNGLQILLKINGPGFESCLIQNTSAKNNQKQVMLDT